MFVNFPQLPLLFFFRERGGDFCQRCDVEIQSGETDFFLFFFWLLFSELFFFWERE